MPLATLISLHVSHAAGVLSDLTIKVSVRQPRDQPVDCHGRGQTQPDAHVKKGCNSEDYEHQGQSVAVHEAKAYSVPLRALSGSDLRIDRIFFGLSKVSY